MKVMLHRASRAALVIVALGVTACADDVSSPDAPPAPRFAIVYNAGLVVNGSFENPVVPSLHPGWISFGNGSSFPGWQVIGPDGVDIHAGEHGAPITNAPDGKQSVDLNGNNPSAIRQMIPTTAGSKYKVEYYMSSNPACDPPVVHLNVEWDGGVVQSASFVTNHHIGNMRWEYHVVTVTASGSSTPLVFRSTSAGGGCGPEIDAVSVHQLDTTPPVVTFTGSNSYTIDQNVDIFCSATDSESGIFAAFCPEIHAPALTIGLGTHTIEGKAQDNAGNVGAGSFTYTITVTSGSLCNLTKQFVDKPGVAHSLCVKLENGAINAYLNELRAQTGKSITAANAAILKALAEAL